MEQNVAEILNNCRLFTSVEPASFDTKTVMDLQLRQKYNVNLVLVKRGEHSKSKKSEKGGIINVPMPNTIIYQDDILMVAGSDVDLAKLPQE